MAMISCHTLTLTRAKKTVCRDLNTVFREGQMWAILGKNGVGKTTLLHALAGLLKPTSGIIYLDNKPIRVYSRKSIAKKMALLTQQDDQHFPNTVFETVMTGRHPHLLPWQWESAADTLIVKHALETLALDALESRLTSSLSGGELRRVAIASILAQTPEIFLLDEPVNHLDLRFKQSVLAHIKMLCQSENKTALVVLHDVNLASLFCDHVLLMFDDGESLAGETSTLLNQKNLERLYDIPLQAIDAGSRVFWNMV